MVDYNKKVKKLFKNPGNMGEIKNPDAIGEISNPYCGDIMKIYLKIKNKKGEDYIKDIKFQTMGCIAAIVTSSMLAKLIKGKTLKKAEKITRKEILTCLGGLPKIKTHCSDLAINTLKKAIKNYKDKKSI